MKRRTFIKTASAAALSGLTRVSFGQQDELTKVIHGGKSFIQGAWQNLDIGITSAGKLKMGPPNSFECAHANCELIVHLKGSTIAPGFIDILADNAFSPEKTYKIFEKFKVSDGVTTALQMHGGSADCAGYYNTFSALPHSINFGVSTSIMRIRYATSSLVEQKKRVEKCLEEGALGVSHSIEYMPTPYNEVLEYAKLAAKYDRTFFLHLRYSSKEQELEGVDEAIRIARESGARVHIDHLHSTGGTFHMKEALDKLRNANAQGLRMTCCVYPYSFWATYLHSKRFDEGWQQRYGLTYHDLRLVGTGERLTKESFAKYRQQHKLAAVPEGTLPLENTVDLALKEDFCMIGSDGGIEYEPHANSHPRGAGCFATSVRHALDIGMPLEKILEKITTLPRSLVLPAMKDRGVLRDGAWADLTIIKPATINGKATVENPNQYSEGIEWVFVNGKAALETGPKEKPAGTAIRNN